LYIEKCVPEFIFKRGQNQVWLFFSPSNACWLISIYESPH